MSFTKECAVCLETLSEMNHRPDNSKCVHLFHLTCLRQQKECPLCRAPFSKVIRNWQFDIPSEIPFYSYWYAAGMYDHPFYSDKKWNRKHEIDRWLRDECGYNSALHSNLTLCFKTFDGEKIEIGAHSDWTLSFVSQLVTVFTALLENQCYLMCRGQNLGCRDQSLTLEECEIPNGDVIHITMRPLCY